MERIVHIAKNFHEASVWEIKQETSMSAEERQKAARILKEKYYGKNRPDIKSALPPR